MELLRCWQSKSGNFLAIRPQKWDAIIDKDDDDENGAHPGAPSGGRSRPGNRNDTGNVDSKENRQGGEKGSAKGTGILDGEWKLKGKAK